MDKASGVYYYLIDNSTRAVGSSLFGGVVPMFTVKGSVGKLLTVTAKDFKDILGYDLGYNPNYLGLETMLQSVSRLEVLRLNQHPCVGNYIWVQKESSGIIGKSEEGIESAASVSVLDLGPGFDAVLWVSHKSPGFWGKFAVWVTDEEVDGEHTYTMFYGAPVAGDAQKYTIIDSKVFSFDETATNFWGKLNFADIVFGFKEGLSSLPTGIVGAKVLLDGGDNGEDIDDLTVDQLLPRLSHLNESASNVIVANGFSQDVGMCSALVEAGEKRIMSVFIDVPDLTSPDDLSADMAFTENDGVLKAGHCIEWAGSLYRSELCQVVSVPDIVNTSVGEVYIWPSVNLFKIYARMFQNYGHVRYPPAGHTYGSIAITKLLQNDFDLYGDELKTARVNFQVVKSRGPVLWEHRTTYGSDSDLSYASTVFILRDLRKRLVDFMSNFNFRFMTPSELLNIGSGLDSILGAFKRDNFLVGYTLTVPSYAEAQAAGRDLDIYISVSVISDAEVINLRVTLENAATLSA
jgi:hypothetical protein